MAARIDSSTRPERTPASRNPADKSEVWDLFLMEFERQAQRAEFGTID